MVEEEVCQGGAEDSTAEQEDCRVGVPDPPRAGTAAGGCESRVVMGQGNGRQRRMRKQRKTTRRRSCRGRRVKVINRKFGGRKRQG